VPELPEVETVVRGLRPRLRGRRIERLRLHQPLIVRGSLSAFRRTLSGARVLQVRRTGKYILVELQPRGAGSRPRYWIVHLGMTGRLYACKATAPRLKHTHLVAWLSGGEQLRYLDPRRFGKMLTLPESDLQSYFAALGPEPFRISLERFRRLCAGRRSPVKNLLLNQSRLRGLGNIYASEALFLARIHPARLAGTLQGSELMRLYTAIRKVLREAIAGQGSTLSDYRNADGVPGDYQNSLRVYDREGEPCPFCGTAIERILLAGRSSHFCPQCQPFRHPVSRAG
jgi:formamidopyrimidine-DNA glycosylase